VALDFREICNAFFFLPFFFSRGHTLHVSICVSSVLFFFFIIVVSLEGKQHRKTQIETCRVLPRGKRAEKSS
jgi:hypothetical protein